MSRGELIETLIAMLSDIAPAVDMTPDKSAARLEDIGYDSLDQSSFLLSIDEQLGVKIEDAQVAKLQTLNDYVEHLSSRL